MATYEGKNIPSWALSELTIRDRKIAQLERELAAAKGEAPAGGWAFLDWYGPDPTAIAGQRNHTIYFPMGDSYVAIAKGTGSAGDYLEVRAEHSIVVQPQSGNVLRVKPGEWF